MPIFVDKGTNVLIQGITGKFGALQTKLMLDCGTKIVAGVTPGKGGQTQFDVPVYDSVQQAVNKHRVDASVIYVPAPFVLDEYTLKQVWLLRRIANMIGSDSPGTPNDATQKVLEGLAKTRDNAEFLATLSKEI